jgi:hypothetical protein
MAALASKLNQDCFLVGVRESESQLTLSGVYAPSKVARNPFGINEP